MSLFSWFSRSKQNEPSKKRLAVSTNKDNLFANNTMWPVASVRKKDTVVLFKHKNSTKEADDINTKKTLKTKNG